MDVRKVYPPFALFCSFYAKVWYLLKAYQYYCIKCKKPPKDMARNDVRIILFIKHKDKDIICIHVFMTTLKKRCTIENRKYVCTYVWQILCRAVGRAKNSGRGRGIICPSFLFEIGLTDLTKSGGGPSLPPPQAPVSLVPMVLLCASLHVYSTFKVYDDLAAQSNYNQLSN